MSIVLGQIGQVYRCSRPIKLVREVVDQMLKGKEARGDPGQPQEENEDVWLNEMD